MAIALPVVEAQLLMHRRSQIPEEVAVQVAITPLVLLVPQTLQQNMHLQIPEEVVAQVVITHREMLA